MERHLRAGDIKLVGKIKTLLLEITEHPRSGTGKPKPLRNRPSETWSRRITDKHRLEYRIEEDRLIIIAIAAYGHYGDK